MEEEEERREEYDTVNQSLTIIKNAVRRQKKLSKFPEIKVNKSSTATSRQQITDWQIIVSSSGCYNYKHTIKTIIIQIIPTMITILKMIKKKIRIIKIIYLGIHLLSEGEEESFLSQKFKLFENNLSLSFFSPSHTLSNINFHFLSKTMQLNRRSLRLVLAKSTSFSLFLLSLGQKQNNKVKQKQTSFSTRTLLLHLSNKRSFLLVSCPPLLTQFIESLLNEFSQTNHFIFHWFRAILDKNLEN